MCLRVDANGCGDGKGTHVSVYAYLIRGEYDDLLKWPFQGSIVVQLCNQLEDNYHCTDTIDFSETADPKVISRVEWPMERELKLDGVFLPSLPTKTLNKSTTFSTSKITVFTFESLPWSHYQNPGCFQWN